MTNYKFVTNWKFDAPIGEVWNAIKHSETWSDWRRGVVCVLESPHDYASGGAEGLTNKLTCEFSIGE